MSPVLAAQGYQLDFEDLYARMWALSVDDRGDGTRLYRPDNESSIKWLIAELAGTPAEPGKTLPANNAMRRQAHQVLRTAGCAERLSQTSFRLLQPPAVASGPVTDRRLPTERTATADPDDEGQSLDGIPADVVSTGDARVTVGRLTWSSWKPLDDAAREATTSPGVYLAKSEHAIVYVGMAGERRGQGVRGRISVYARGRGAVSGLGEAALDRALADPAWVADRLRDLTMRGPRRATEWASAAMSRRPIEICWAEATSTAEARDWEERVLTELTDADLWNRRRPRDA